MNQIAIFSFLVILYEISIVPLYHILQCQPANLTGFYWIKILINLYTDLKFLVSVCCFCTVVQPQIEGLRHVYSCWKTYMVGPLVICVVFMDAPVRFFTGYRTEKRLYPDIKFHQVPNNTGYRLPVYKEVNKNMHISWMECIWKMKKF